MLRTLSPQPSVLVGCGVYFSSCLYMIADLYLRIPMQLVLEPTGMPHDDRL